MENLQFQLLFTYDAAQSRTGNMCCLWIINNPFRTGCGLSSRKFVVVNASERSMALKCSPTFARSLPSFSCAACQLLKYGY